MAAGQQVLAPDGRMRTARRKHNWADELTAILYEARYTKTRRSPGPRVLARTETPRNTKCTRSYAGEHGYNEIFVVHIPCTGETQKLANFIIQMDPHERHYNALVLQ